MVYTGKFKTFISGPSGSLNMFNFECRIPLKPVIGGVGSVHFLLLPMNSLNQTESAIVSFLVYFLVPSDHLIRTCSFMKFSLSYQDYYWQKESGTFRPERRFALRRFAPRRFAPFEGRNVPCIFCLFLITYY